MEAPGGTVSVEAECRDGKAERIRVVNLRRSLIASTRLSTCPASGRFESTRPSGRQLRARRRCRPRAGRGTRCGCRTREVGRTITAAANEQLGFSHPQYPEWSHLSFCQIAGPLERTSDGFELQSTSVIDPANSIVRRRAPVSRPDPPYSTPEACFSGRPAHNAIGDRIDVRRFDRWRARRPGRRPARSVAVDSRTGMDHRRPRHLVDPTDPWPTGYRVADTLARSVGSTAMPRPFRFGLQTHGPIEGMSWTDTAKYAEQQGYSSIMVPDHFHGQYGPMTALAAAAAVTTEIKVGALCFRQRLPPPGDARQGDGDTDRIAEGRVEFGLGAGWMRTDYDESGMPYDRPGFGSIA